MQNISDFTDYDLASFPSRFATHFSLITQWKSKKWKGILDNQSEEKAWNLRISLAYEVTQTATILNLTKSKGNKNEGKLIRLLVTALHWNRF